MAVLGREAASQAMTSADIVDGAFTLNDLNFTDVPANLDITGTIDKHTMRLADGITVTGDVTISDDLVLAKLSDDGDPITMTTDGTTRTITGSGSIESTTIAQTHSPSLTGMTGTVGNAVTMPQGSVLQVQSGTYNTVNIVNNAAFNGVITNLRSDSITTVSGNKVIITVSLPVYIPSGDKQIYATLYRGSTILDSVGLALTNSTAGGWMDTMSFTYVDIAPTSAAHVYGVGLKCQSSTDVHYCYASSTFTITCMEIQT